MEMVMHSAFYMYTPGGGSTPLYEVYRYVCRPKGYGFWAVLVWKREKILNIFVWNWVWLSRGRSRKLINLFFFPATGASNW